MPRKLLKLSPSAGFFALLLTCAQVFAQVAPPLGTAANFTLLGTNGIPTVGTVTCTTSTINGSVGTTFPGGITNTGPCVITGTITSPILAGVVTDFNAAKAAVDAEVCTGVIPIVTTTLPPGVYCSAAGTTIGAGVTLTLLGNATDVWIFRVGTGGLGSLTLNGPGANVVMGGAGQACNVYWRSAQATALTNSNFVGTVLAGTAFTATGGTYLGRGMATTDATVTSVVPMTFAGCVAGGLGGVGIPTLSEWAMVLLASLLAMVGLAVIRRRNN